jgi:hypothetical protein
VAERVLSPRQLNRAVLARQLLLARSPLPLERALEQVAGLQAQYAPSAYVALWSRLEGFRRQQLTDALLERRAVQATLMRSTIHVVAAGDYRLLAEGIRNGRQAWWRRVQGGRLGDVDMAAVAALLRGHLAGGPRRQADLVAALTATGFPRAAWSGAGLWLDLVRVPPSGTWERRRADLYGLADDWLGPSPAVSEAEGLAHLTRRYLGGFGPASPGDLAGWAGLPLGAFRDTLARLPLCRFRDEHGGELVDLPGAPLPEPDTSAPVRFLPTWDATLLVHARRTQILPERYRSLVFNTKTPHSVPTFLVDGAVAGTWRHERNRVGLEPFGRLPRQARQELDEEAERLAAFHQP